MRVPMILTLAVLALARPALADPKLDKALTGKVAGKPVDCISLPRVRSSTTFTKPDSILYRVGRVSYLNQPAGGCGFRMDPIIVSRTPTTQLCRGDIISVVDRGSRIPMGSCGLGSFTPYTAAK
ncbi:MAG TPA: hypothetical protein VF649_09645 [Sphingomonas sp.]|jgi:hypothetical protein|uniref:hypothetical protein n=1 Tax=Sphingomonas sp. TaxID=28214 RepID=UPI002EDB8F04